ncbi:uncharacterized protein LOC126901531 [Daktulosphaira vitifoliae]|uniref:uncharacterized protein LOC126901531 n=1 Tax=Daktulosphaira vitifoliae TaxID=58002 RepID=UPI0021AA5579|nr:uncharacterized protein LOC126901531 [Daktulosphaira vitifoliae]
MFLMIKVAILYIVCSIKSFISRELIEIPYKFYYPHGDVYYFSTTYLDLPYHYKPVDNEWCREKCTSLGFTYQKSIMNQKLTPNKIPVEFYFNKNGLFDVLSDLICRDRKFSLDMYRNTSINRLKNKDIKKFVRNSRRFQKNIKPGVENIIWELDIFAAAYYLDVCIYLFEEYKNIWIYFRKGWPQYKKVDMKNEKCIYLYTCENYIGVVTNVTGPY